MFSTSVDVLGIIQEDSLHSEEKGEVYQFAFALHLMKFFWESQMSCQPHCKRKIKIL